MCQPRFRRSSPAGGSLPLRGGGVCVYARTPPPSPQRTRDRDSLHGDASVEAAHGPLLAAPEQAEGPALDQPVWGSCSACGVPRSLRFLQGKGAWIDHTAGFLTLFL